MPMGRILKEPRLWEGTGVSLGDAFVFKDEADGRFGSLF